MYRISSFLVVTAFFDAPIDVLSDDDTGRFKFCHKIYLLETASVEDASSYSISAQSFLCYERPRLPCWYPRKMFTGYHSYIEKAVFLNNLAIFVLDLLRFLKCIIPRQSTPFPRLPHSEVLRWICVITRRHMQPFFNNQSTFENIPLIFCSITNW